jgi:tetratricopeptide (TPR) repeat protein
MCNKYTRQRVGTGWVVAFAVTFSIAAGVAGGLDPHVQQRLLFDQGLEAVKGKDSSAAEARFRAATQQPVDDVALGVGNTPEAEALCREVLVLDKDKHLESLFLVNDVAVRYVDSKHFDKALPLYEQALALCDTNLRREAPDTVVMFKGAAKNNLGLTLSRLGRYREAKQMFESAISLRSDAFGAESNIVADSKVELAKCHAALREYSDAERLLKSAIKSYKESMYQKPQIGSAVFKKRMYRQDHSCGRCTG